MALLQTIVHLDPRLLAIVGGVVRPVSPALLPLNNHHLLLIGHDNGLSVLDMFPNDWNEDNETEKGPSDAEAKVIWEGEG